MKNKVIPVIILLTFICVLNNFCIKHGYEPQSYFSKEKVYNIKKVAVIPTERENDYIIDKLSAYIGSRATFDLVESSIVRKRLDEMNLKYTDVIDSQVGHQIRDIFGIDGIIVVSYKWKEISLSRRSISLSAKLIELETGLILWHAEKSIECDLENLISEEDYLCKFIAATLYSNK